MRTSKGLIQSLICAGLFLLTAGPLAFIPGNVGLGVSIFFATASILFILFGPVFSEKGKAKGSEFVFTGIDPEKFHLIVEAIAQSELQLYERALESAHRESERQRESFFSEIWSVYSSGKLAEPHKQKKVKA